MNACYALELTSRKTTYTTRKVHYGLARKHKNAQNAFTWAKRQVPSPSADRSTPVTVTDHIFNIAIIIAIVVIIKVIFKIVAIASSSSSSASLSFSVNVVVVLVLIITIIILIMTRRYHELLGHEQHRKFNTYKTCLAILPHFRMMKHVFTSIETQK